ncbi:hypothetical protein AX767_09890 [Variovorax sp. PAMC 28711]|nr:hypothetical protein AX767_09890 [Variovorax sp. PAMC 28711]
MFAAAHYAALAVFVASCWGFGRAVLTRIGPPVRRDGGLEAAMAVALGIGLFICAFQALAIGGVFGLAGVLVIVALGVALALVQAPGCLRELRTAKDTRPLPWVERGALAVLALVALPALVAPLAPPAAFDELMYHLPYARTVAQTGSLGIHDWLRYPWFPYNFNLLYAGGLLVDDDVLPHLLNGLGGAVSVWMVYRLGLQHTSRVIACGGAAIWLGLGDYSNALIDMGVALFVLSACVALWWWREAAADRATAGAPATRWLCVAAFFLGLAAGSKYQALTFMPLMGLFVLWHERRPKVLALALLCFLIPCIYWYARNAITTGDPFNPIGARLFGFTNWNAADYKNQFDDVQAHAAWPNAMIWPVLLAPFSPWFRRSAAVRAAVVFCAYSLVVWFATSRYPRYMTASYPLIAWMAAVGWTVLLGALLAAVRKGLPALASHGAASRAGAWVGGVLLAALAVASVYQTAQKIAMVSPTPELREAFLRKNVPGYAAMHYLRTHPQGRVYQVALSEAIYYGPDAVWGDTLGPWRYMDFLAAAPDDMARKFASLGFGAMVVAAPYVAVLEAKPGFARHFVLLYEKDGAKAYRILADAP